jgi:hypothetical protein
MGGLDGVVSLIAGPSGYSSHRQSGAQFVPNLTYT